VCRYRKNRKKWDTQTHKYAQVHTDFSEAARLILGQDRAVFSLTLTNGTWRDDGVMELSTRPTRNISNKILSPTL